MGEWTKERHKWTRMTAASYSEIERPDIAVVWEDMLDHIERLTTQLSEARASELATIAKYEQMANAALALQERADGFARDFGLALERAERAEREAAGERERAEDYRTRLVAYEAPVDVEGEVTRRASEAEGRYVDICERLGNMSSSVWPYVIRPLVTEKARLAREVERLHGRERLSEMRKEVLDMMASALHFPDASDGGPLADHAARVWREREEARAELAALKSTRGEALSSALDRLAAGEWTATVITLATDAWKGRAAVEPAPITTAEQGDAIASAVTTLTEEEARAWAGRVMRAGFDQSLVKQLGILADAILRASRGDIPKEVRPTVERARLDTDGTAKPKTRIIHHPPEMACMGPGTPLHAPEYEDEKGKRTPLMGEP